MFRDARQRLHRGAPVSPHVLRELRGTCAAQGWCVLSPAPCVVFRVPAPVPPCTLHVSRNRAGVVPVRWRRSHSAVEMKQSPRGAVGKLKVSTIESSSVYCHWPMVRACISRIIEWHRYRLPHKDRTDQQHNTTNRGQQTKHTTTQHNTSVIGKVSSSAAVTGSGVLFSNQ